MKWAVRAAVAVVALALVAVGVLVWALPRLAKSDAARAKIEAVARAALGRELRYGEIDFGLLPPSLVVEEPVVAGETEADPPLARADRIALRVELLPLLRRQLEVSSLAVDGLDLHLVRTQDGIALPGRRAETDGPAEPDAPEGEDEGLAFGIRRVEVRDSSLVLEDRTARPAGSWTVGDIDVTAVGSGAGQPVSIEGALRDVKGGALAVEGPLALEAELDRLAAGATGPFRIDAGDAAIRYGADFTKPSGTPAEVRGRVVAGDGGALAIDDLEIELHNLTARGQLRTAPRTELRLRADAFSLDGWDAIVPPLGVVKPSGRIAIPELAVATEPLSARGRIELQEVVAEPPDRPPITLRGGVDLLGTELRTRDLVVAAAQQSFRVSGQVQQLFTAPRYEIGVETEGADTNALLTSLAEQPDRVLGPLDVKGTFRGALSGETSLLDALSGDLSFGIENGRIVGASLLQAVLGSFGATLAEAARGRGGRDWERFYGEEFEFLRGAMRIADGVLLADPLALRYRDYAAQLEGPIRLADLSLDMTGTITFEEELDSALARAFGAGDEYTPQIRTIPLAQVRGTLGAPKVQIAGKAIASLAAGYATSSQRAELRQRVEKELEEELGAGSGEIVDQGLSVLEGILGGRKRQPTEPAPDAGGAGTAPAEPSPPADPAPAEPSPAADPGPNP